MIDLSTIQTAAAFVGDAVRLPLPDRSVDLVVCSPPYEGARTYGIGFKLTGQAWVEFAVTRYLECLRVCRGLVVWVVAGTTDDYRWSATPALLMADLHRRRVCLRNPPVFARVGIPGSGGKDWLRADYEWCICATATRGRLPWADNTAMGHPPKWAPGGEMSHRLTDGTRRNQWGASAKSTRTRRKTGERQQFGEKPSHVYMTKREAAKVEAVRNGHALGVDPPKRVPGVDGDVMQTQAYTPPKLANPGNIIRCTVGGGQMGSKLAHENEAPFPESLVEFFVRSFCPPGGIVLDPFVGSGTTLAASIKAGRRAIGFDIRESQVRLSERRIAEATERKASA